LNELQDRLGIAILIITHNLNVVRHVAHRVAVMYLGRIVEEGPTADVFSRPQHRYTAALLSANPVPDPDAARNRLEIRGDVPSLLSRPSGCEFHPRCPFAVPAVPRGLPSHRRNRPGPSVRLPQSVRRGSGQSARSRSRLTMLEFDFIIVCAGSAGCVVRRPAFPVRSLGVLVPEAGAPKFLIKIRHRLQPHLS
jgi:peptide/nickel transport system ATP-binding protein